MEYSAAQLCIHCQNTPIVVLGRMRAIIRGSTSDQVVWLTDAPLRVCTCGNIYVSRIFNKVRRYPTTVIDDYGPFVEFPDEPIMNYKDYLELIRLVEARQSKEDILGFIKMNSETQKGNILTTIAPGTSPREYGLYAFLPPVNHFTYDWRAYHNMYTATTTTPTTTIPAPTDIRGTTLRATIIDEIDEVPPIVRWALNNT